MLFAVAPDFAPNSGPSAFAWRPQIDFWGYSADAGTVVFFGSTIVVPFLIGLLTNKSKVIGIFTYTAYVLSLYILDLFGASKFLGGRVHFELAGFAKAFFLCAPAFLVGCVSLWAFGKIRIKKNAPNR